MKGPPSCGHVFKIGSSRRLTSSPRWMTCLQGGIFGGDDFRKEVAYLGQHWQQFELVHKVGRHLRLDEGADGGRRWRRASPSSSASLMRRSLPN